MDYDNLPYDKVQWVGLRYQKCGVGLITSYYALYIEITPSLRALPYARRPPY
jgi:hypothetical protein